MPYPYGNAIRSIATFYASQSPSGLAIDAASVYLMVRNPLGSVASYGYGISSSLASGPQILRVATGAYYCDFLASIAGEWNTRWESGTFPQAAYEKQFVVNLNTVI